MTLTKKQIRSSRIRMDNRPHGRGKQASALRRLRRKFRGQADSALRKGDMAAGRRVLSAAKRAFNFAAGAFRRSGGRGE